MCDEVRLLMLLGGYTRSLAADAMQRLLELTCMPLAFLASCLIQDAASMTHAALLSGR